MSPLDVVFVVVAVLAALALVLVGFTALAAAQVARVLPPRGRFVEVPGARLHVQERGAGPPMLMIHGLAGQSAHFTYALVDRLAARWRVVVVDRPGAGWSVRAPGASATLGAQADAMAALIDAMGLGRCVVVGHSLGGAVALALAQRHPERVAALALLAPLTHRPETVPAAFDGLAITNATLRRIVAWTLALPVTLAKRRAILELVFGPDPVPPDFELRGGALLGARPSHFIGASTDLAAVESDLPEMAERYPSMTVPVGVLYGRGDRILDPQSQGRALADKVPGARLELVEGGHMLPMTLPDDSARFIEATAARAIGAAAAGAPAAGAHA
jgi:pimeloyl-ACP methyl ester carboxylesterase